MVDFSIDFSPLANLGKTYDQAKMQAQRENILASAPTDGNPQSLAALGMRLAQAGDPSGLQLAQQAYLHSPEYITATETAKAKVAEQFAPKTSNIKLPGGEEVTVLKGPNGFSIPQVQGAPAPDPSIPAGADVKAIREARGKAAAANEEEAVKSAKAAADFQPIIDQAIAAYERAIKANAIGPVVGSTIARGNERYNPFAQIFIDPEREKSRQDYDLAKAALQARITAAQNKGEGAVSNFERQMYAAQFPDLTSMEPAKQLEYLKQIQAQTRQTVGAGRIPALGQTAPVGAVLERPSITNSLTPGPQPAPKPVTQAPPAAVIQAARANPPAAIAAAKDAIAKGADPRVVAEHLQASGIDPRFLNAPIGADAAPPLNLSGR